jgi:hypothetical protein
MALKTYVCITIIIVIFIVMTIFSKNSCSFCEYVSYFHGLGDEQDNNF